MNYCKNIKIAHIKIIYIYINCAAAAAVSYFHLKFVSIQLNIYILQFAIIRRLKFNVTNYMNFLRDFSL